MFFMNGCYTLSGNAGLPSIPALTVAIELVSVRDQIASANWGGSYDETSSLTDQYIRILTRRARFDPTQGEQLYPAPLTGSPICEAGPNDYRGRNMRSFINTGMSGQRFKSAPFGARSKPWNPDAVGADGSQSPRKHYERYMALARLQALSGDMVGAENCYRYAEHYFRSISTPPGQ
jgi:Domain of unknown function (DUF4167)